MNGIDRWAERLHAAIGGRETDRPQEVAEIVAHFVLELEDGPARGVLGAVRHALQNAEHERQVEALRTMPQCPSTCMGERCRHVRGHEGLHHDDSGGEWRD